MGFNRLETDVELRGDLFAGEPLDNQVQNLVFARRQTTHALPHHRHRTAFPPSSAVQGQGPTDLLQQDVVVERLFQELDGTVLERADRRGNVAIAREHDDGDLDVAFV